MLGRHCDISDEHLLLITSHTHVCIHDSQYTSMLILAMRSYLPTHPHTHITPTNTHIHTQKHIHNTHSLAHTYTHTYIHTHTPLYPPHAPHPTPHQPSLPTLPIKTNHHYSLLTPFVIFQPSAAVNTLFLCNNVHDLLVNTVNLPRYQNETKTAAITTTTLTSLPVQTQKLLWRYVSL